MIKKGFLEARCITKKFARSFYFASFFLPNEKRYAAYAVYTLCRISDESVDNSTGGYPRLEELKVRIDSAYGQAPLSSHLLSAFRDTINEYKIPREYFATLLEGMRSDLYKTRYRSFAELYDYCYKVAGVVGLIMLKIFGYKDSRAEKYAVELGIAMQLTNILRDIQEDFLRGRIYLPLDEMQRYKITEQDISAGRLTFEFVDFLKYEIQRARQYYREAEKGINLIHSKRCRLTVRTMKEIYAKILDEIENNHYDIFSRRIYVKNMQKMNVLLKIIFRRGYREN